MIIPYMEIHRTCTREACGMTTRITSLYASIDHHYLIEGGSMTDQQQELFNDFESLEQAMLNNMISLDTYLNEYNRMVQEEGRRTAEASPWERAT